MRALLIAAAPADELIAALEAEGISVEPSRMAQAASAAPSAALVAGLRGAEEALAAEPPDVVLVAGDDDSALMATLTAVKLQIPTGWLRPRDAPEDPLIARVADAALDATSPAGDLASQVRDLAARTIPAP